VIKFQIMRKEILRKGFAFVVMISMLTALFAMPEYVFADNGKPVAVLDGTFNVKQGETVYLDASESSDPGGAELDYNWTLLSTPEGSSAVLDDSFDSQASFDADAVGTYRVKLVVNNGLTDSDPVYAEILVTEGE
jgi:hypothetical protein